METTPRARTAVPIWPSLAAGILATALYLLLTQEQPHGDGITYIWYLQQGEWRAHHLLYLALLGPFGELCGLAGVELRAASFLFSALCGGAAVLLFDRLLRSSRALCPGFRQPALGTLTLALSPATLFFATTVENHAHHLMWCAVLLLTLDRVLAADEKAGGRPALWLFATLALLAVYTSHSSSLLLWPGLLLWLYARGGPLLRKPEAGFVLRALLLFAPVLAFKLWEPAFKVRLLGMGEEQMSDQHTRFALDLLDWRDVATWLRYLWFEFLLPLGPTLVLAAVRLRGREWLTAATLLLPYVLFFGHWNVYEHGAYYLAPMIALLVLTAGARRAPILPASALGPVLGLLAACAAYGIHDVWTSAHRDPRAAWIWARDVQHLSTKHSTVIVHSGFRGVTLLVDTDIEDVVMLENWWIHMGPSVKAMGPEQFTRWTEERMPELFAAWTGPGKGPLLLGDEAYRALERDWPPVLAWLQRHARFEAVEYGIVRGYRLEPR